MVDVLLADLDDSKGWEPCLRSLRLSGHDLVLHAVVDLPGSTEHLQAVAPELVELVADSAAAALAELRGLTPIVPGRDVLVISRPVVVPPGFLEPALALLDDDLRYATVSLLNNDAGYLSFPHRNTPWNHQVENLDEVSVTRRLRQRSPELAPAPIPLAVGPIALLAGTALDALGHLPDTADSGEELIAAVSLAAQRKGFMSVVDPATFCLAPHDTDPGDPDNADIDRIPDRTLDEKHRRILDEERYSHSSPFAVLHQVCKAKAFGLRVGIDGTCLGPKEMGTQVQTLNIIRALVADDEVAEVTVALAGPIPGYAQSMLTHEKVRTVHSTDDDMSAMGHVDVLHRPFQPQRQLDIDSWRKVGYRVVVSILDVIAYRNGEYHVSGAAWLAYRDAMRSALAEVDGVTVISGDVKDQMLLDRLPIDPARIHVVELGTDHLSGLEAERPPHELLERGFVAEQFLVVLGATYAHKNRDQAIRAVQELRAQGRDIGLVLVGASVPHGSSRQLESLALGTEDASRWLWSIPDVAPEERNWLLRHAEAMLYPTSAEGFGFNPFEAARFGTPTLCVPFGPLAELAPDLPVSPASWHARDLAAAVEQVLSDPAVARDQVNAVIEAGGSYTWERTAQKLVTVYRDLLASPSR
jgi:glycosyltransferase involved in cell wall biosynthesis